MSKQFLGWAGLTLGVILANSMIIKETLSVPGADDYSTVEDRHRTTHGRSWAGNSGFPSGVSKLQQTLTIGKQRVPSGVKLGGALGLSQLYSQYDTGLSQGKQSSSQARLGFLWE